MDVGELEVCRGGLIEAELAPRVAVLACRESAGLSQSSLGKEGAFDDDVNAGRTSGSVISVEENDCSGRECESVTCRDCDVAIEVDDAGPGRGSSCQCA